MKTLVLSTFEPRHHSKDRPLTAYELKYVAPYYKFGATVAKYRKLPPTPENVKAHAAALFSQLATFQKQEFRKDIQEPDRCPCASGTWHADGAKILEAVNAQNKRAVESALAESWRKRTDAQVGAAYRAAMEGRDAPLTHNIYVRGN